MPGEGAVVAVVQRDSGGTGSSCSGGVRTSRSCDSRLAASVRVREGEEMNRLKNLKGSGAHQCING